MSFCVIAVKDNFQYRAVFCRVSGSLETTLRSAYNSLSSAKCLIGLGDISQLEPNCVRSYCRDWGFSWSYACPAEMGSLISLRDYARSAGVSMLYLFDDRGWDTHRLTVDQVALDFVA